MIESDAAADTRRANQARAKLISDIRQIKKMGDQMIQKTETALHKAPVLLGLGAVGVALVSAAVYAGRASSSSSRRLRSRFTHERSFFAEAARSAALSALGILAGRVTQRLLTAAMNDATAEPHPHAAE